MLQSLQRNKNFRLYHNGQAEAQSRVAELEAQVAATKEAAEEVARSLKDAQSKWEKERSNMEHALATAQIQRLRQVRWRQLMVLEEFSSCSAAPGVV